VEHKQVNVPEQKLQLILVIICLLV